MCMSMYIPVAHSPPDEIHMSPLVKAQLESLKDKMSPEIVPTAAAAGDVSTIRSFLKEQPNEVHVVCFTCMTCNTHSPGHPSTLHDAWYWLRCTLHSG